MSNWLSRSLSPSKKFCPNQARSLDFRRVIKDTRITTADDNKVENGQTRFNEANESKKRDQQLHRFADLRFQVAAAAAAASVCIRDSVRNAPCISDYSLYVIPILRGLVTLNIRL